MNLPYAAFLVADVGCNATLHQNLWGEKTKAHNEWERGGNQLRDSVLKHLGRRSDVIIRVNDKTLDRKPRGRRVVT